MRRSIVGSLLGLMLLAGCEGTARNTPTTRDNEGGVKVRAPGVDVDVKKQRDGGVDVDVDVGRKGAKGRDGPSD